MVLLLSARPTQIIVAAMQTGEVEAACRCKVAAMK